MGFFLIISLYLVYNLLVPVYDFLGGSLSFFGFQFPEASLLMPQMAWVYGCGLFSFLLAYFLYPSQRKNYSAESTKPAESENFVNIMIGLQFGVWVLLFLNFHLSGIDIFQILNPENQEEKNILFSADLAIPGLDLLSNCLPVCLFLHFRFAKKPGIIWFLLFGFWLIFSLLAGWRYRIILFFLFIVFHFWDLRKLNGIRILTLGFFALLLFSWLTLNRMAIAKRQFQLITWDLRQFDLGILTNEFSNSRTFRGTLLYLESNPKMESDGLSWFRFVGNKWKPKTSFQNQTRPKPWILEVTKAWIPTGWPWNPNPAVSQMEELFLTFSYPGLVIGMALLGFWVAFLDFSRGGLIFSAFRLVAIALLFQWTTRGFFLYQIQISLFCLLPLGLLWGIRSYLPHAISYHKA